MNNRLNVRDLACTTGCGLMECKKAMKCAQSHGGDKSMAIAYLKAKGFAVATPTMTFDERVQLFLADGENDGE